MNHRKLIVLAVLALLTVLLLSACVRGGSGGSGPTPTPTDCDCSLEGPLNTATPLPQEGPAESLAPTGQQSASIEATADRSPRSSQQAAAPSLDPEDWREWPVVPARISDDLRAVYQRGLAAGNRADRFTKIGDCQSIKEAMMGFYDMPGRYRLPDGKSYLSSAIEQFQGSFNRDGQGVKGGYNAAAVLSPMWADPQVCQPGESPLACEIRDYQPSIVLISLEVWWDGRTPERYVDYMRRIIEYSLEKGVVPILSTKADNVEGDHAINLATAKLAAEYDLPLWNFWAAAQKLPNRGLDPTRPDGFHISYEAWNIRSRTALEAVDAVWRLLNQQDVPVGALASTPTAPPLALSTATRVPRQVYSGERVVYPDQEELLAQSESPALLLEISEREGEQSLPTGIYRLRVGEGGELERVSDGGELLAGSAPNGSFLAARGTDGWIADPPHWYLFSDWLAADRDGAYFLSDYSAVIALRGEPGQMVRPAVLPLDGSRLRLLAGGDGADRPARLLPAPAAGRVFWTTTTNVDEIAPVWASPLDGGEAEFLGEFFRPSVSPDGSWLAHWEEPAADASDAANEVLLLRRLSGGSERSMPLPAGLFDDAAWSPDGRTLAVALSHRSDYSGRVFGSQVVLVEASSLGVSRLPEQEGINPRLLFSPDGRTLYRAATVGDSAGYRVTLQAVEIAGGRSSEVPLDLRSEDFLWISAWSTK